MIAFKKTGRPDGADFCQDVTTTCFGMRRTSDRLKFRRSFAEEIGRRSGCDRYDWLETDGRCRSANDDAETSG